MLKFITLALAIGMCSCQTLVDGAHGPIVTGGTGIQYLLVPVGTGVAPTTQLSLSPYLSRQPYAISAPSTTLIQAPAPTIIQAAPTRIAVPRPAPVVVQAPRPVVLQAPQPQIVSQEVHGPPQPYQFGYQSTDEYGNTLSRSETADGSGTVTGSYSYIDSEGLTRVVEYVADAAGFRANVKTNEPGTANANPADVQIQSSEPPANVQATVAAYSAPRQAQARVAQPVARPAARARAQ